MSDRNRTYERALSAFFNNSDLTDEQKGRLPSEVDGLSVRRKRLISAVLEAQSERARTLALKRLHSAFGLPTDLRVLTYALSPDEPNLALQALKQLMSVLEDDLTALEEHREPLLKRLSTLEVRLFHEEALTLTQACLKLLRASLISGGDAQR